MAEQVRVKGIEKVLKNLKNLESHLQKKALVAGARKGANKFKRGIVSRAPHKTGSLKASVKTKQMSKTLSYKGIVGAMVLIGAKLSKAQRKKIQGSRDAWYWFLQEYGWTPTGRWRKSLDSGEKLNANRGLTREAFRSKAGRTRNKKAGLYFIKRSFDAIKNKVKDNYAKDIHQAIEKYRGG